MTLLDTTHARLIAAAALALGLQGCASMSKNECVSADWYAIGYESGVAGQRDTQLSKYRKSCADHGVTPDLARYLEGRDVGLQRYCEPRNGYRLGRAGYGNSGICPQRLAGEFTRAHSAGRELYDTEQNIHRLGRHINARQAEIKTLNEDLAYKQAALIAVGTLPAQRALLLVEVVELRDKMKNIERDIYESRLARDRERELLADQERREAGR